MLSKRQLRIIACLSGASGWNNGNDIAKIIGISKRTLLSDIQKINAELNGQGKIVSNNRLGYRLDIPESLAEQLLNQGQKKELNAQEIYGRSKQILMLLLFENDFITIDSIADRLFLSKSSVNSIFPQVKRVISRTSGMELEVSSRKGIRIIASENVKRFMCMKTLGDSVDYSALLGYPDFDDIFIYEEKLKRIVESVFWKYNFIVTGDAYKEFVRYIAICIYRSKHAFSEEGARNIEISRPVSEIIEKVKKEIGYQFTKAEEQYIELRIHELNLIEKHPVKEEEILDALHQFTEKVERETGFRLEMEEDLYMALADHIIRLKRRISEGRQNIGNYTKEVFSQYPLEMHLLKTCMCPVLGMDIPDAELGYIILYIALAINKCRRKLSVLLLSDADAGIIFYLKKQLSLYLSDMVKEIRVLPVYLFSQIQEQYQETDWILITTETQMAIQNKNFRLLNEFARPEEMEYLRKKVYTLCMERWNEKQKELRRKYISDSDKGHTPKKETELDSLMKMMKIDPASPNVSIESIGKHTLCIISHLKVGHSMIRCYPSNSAISYKGKKITEVLVANYGGEGDMIDFFDLFKEILGEYIKQ